MTHRTLSISDVEGEAFRAVNARLEEALALRKRGKEGQAWIMIENLYSVLPEPHPHNRLATSNRCIKAAL